MSYPAITAVPELIAKSPVSILNVVVLPAPLTCGNAPLIKQKPYQCTNSRVPVLTQLHVV